MAALTTERLVLAVMVYCGASAIAPADDTRQQNVSTVLDFTMKNIDGKNVLLGDYQGQVVMLVNVASKCGYTPQYKDLESLYRKYEKQGFAILAFPANNFGRQEPGTNKDIKAFCKSKFDVTFDLFAKVSVKGEDQCPLYKYLTDKDKNGRFGGEIRWNFQKFLVDRDGEVIARFEPGDNPMSEKVIEALEDALVKAPATPKGKDQD